MTQKCTSWTKAEVFVKTYLVGSKGEKYPRHFKMKESGSANE